MPRVWQPGAEVARRKSRPCTVPITRFLLYNATRFPPRTGFQEKSKWENVRKMLSRVPPLSSAGRNSSFAPSCLLDPLLSHLAPLLVQFAFLRFADRVHLGDPGVLSKRSVNWQACSSPLLAIGMGISQSRMSPPPQGPACEKTGAYSAEIPHTPPPPPTPGMAKTVRDGALRDQVLPRPGNFLSAASAS